MKLSRYRYLVLIGLFALLLGACNGAQHIVDAFNPDGIGLGDTAEVQRGPLRGETVTVTGYDGRMHVTVEQGDGTQDDLPLSHLGVQSSTYYWCVGEWEWVIDPTFGEGFWDAPHSDLVISRVDLRTVGQFGKAGGIPEGSGLFLYHTDPQDPDLTCKTDASEKGRALVSDVEKALISTRLGVLSEVEPVTICGVFLDYMVTHAAEIGINPIERASDGLYRIHLGPLKCEGLPPFE